MTKLALPVSFFSLQEMPGYVHCTLAFDVAHDAGHCQIRRHVQQHHHKRSFREELIELPEKAGIPYEAKYLE